MLKGRAPLSKGLVIVLNGERTPTVLVGVSWRDWFPPVNVESAGEIVDPALAQAAASRVAGAEYGGGGLAAPLIPAVSEVQYIWRQSKPRTKQHTFALNVTASAF